jgi:glycosyltransferase involved in cell wall biosynthesis
VVGERRSFRRFLLVARAPRVRSAGPPPRHPLIPVSAYGRDALIREDIPSARITPILNGIPLDRYRRSASTLLRDRPDLRPREPLIGLAGRITPWKGQHPFLRIASEWAGQNRPGRFVFIGRAFNEDAPIEAEPREFIRVEKRESRVLFVAFQSDIAAALSLPDVLLHCSTTPEPFGRVSIEAVAVGKPVIAARAGGVPEIIAPGVDGGLAGEGA